MIQHISIFKAGKREIIKPDKDGKFKVMEGARTITSTPKAKYLSASDFVKHPDIKDYDPTITLDSGGKMRVYHAGNSTIPLVHPSLVLEQFDKKARNLRKTVLEKKLETLKKNKDSRKEETTQPMGAIPPLVPPYPGPVRVNKKVSVSNAPPQKKASDPSDPFSSLIDEWFGDAEDLDDPNDGLYSDDYPYVGYDDD